MSLTKIMSTKSSDIDEVIEDMKRIISQYSFEDITNEYPQLGEGTTAKVFEVNGKALRIEPYTNRKKANQYDLLRDNTFEYVIDIFYNKVVKIRNIYYLFTVMELLDPVDDKYLDDLDKFDDNYGYPYERTYYGDDIKNIRHIIEDINKGVDELREKVKIEPDDIWQENIMYDSKNDRYKIIDVFGETIK